MIAIIIKEWEIKEIANDRLLFEKSKAVLKIEIESIPGKDLEIKVLSDSEYKKNGQ